MFTFPLLFYQTGTKDTRHIYGQKKEGGFLLIVLFPWLGKVKLRITIIFFLGLSLPFPSQELRPHGIPS